MDKFKIDGKKTIIGVSGLARTGKNLFCDIAIKQLEEQSKIAQQFALADELKRDCEQFIKTKLGLDVWSEDTDVKNIFRPMLVWYGGVKRKQTQARYWIEKLVDIINRNNAEIVFISDIRYAEYEYDELQFIKDNGYLVHISKYERYSPYFDELPEVIDESKVKRRYVEPPNDDEKKNDPILKENADLLIEWEHQKNQKMNQLIKNEYLNDIVCEVLTKILK